MTATVTTTTTTTTYFDGGPPPSYIGTLHLTGGDSPELQDIINHSGCHNMQPDQVSQWLNSLPVPDSVKNMIRNMMGLGSENNLPSDSSAAKTINQFQKDHDIGLMSSQQMQQVAETGYFTDKNGKTIQVPPEVQAAAQTFMANNGELFKKMESATDGKHDGQLGQGDYGNAIKDGTISANPSSSNNGPVFYGVPKGCFMDAVMNGNISPNRPSEYGAAKTINDFQKDHDIGLLSSQQMQQIAETGYFTDKNGKTIQVPPEVQAAAQTFMANNGELFKKLESATDGKHDGQLGQGDFGNAIKDGTIAPGGNQPGNGPNYNINPGNSNYNTGGSSLPSESGAAKTINQFQKDHDIGLMSSQQMQQVAETGYFTDKNGKTIQVPPEVQAAAQAFMANNGELFKKLESATDGKHDGQLGQGDYGNAIKDGSISADGGGPPVVDRTGTFGTQNPNTNTNININPGNSNYNTGGSSLPSESGAAKTINQFQKDHDIGLMSSQQMQQVAETGYFTDKNGKTIQVPPEVQAAAQALMANNGELFKKLESATDGKHDGQLGQGDYGNAIKDGSISADGGGPPVVDRTGTFGNSNVNLPPTGGNQLPSDSSAAKTINQFQKDHDVGLMSSQQMQQAAETGYFTDKNGKTIQVPPEVQAAAQALMANNGELFKKLESATDGKHDGQLGQGDYGNAIKDGTIS